MGQNYKEALKNKLKEKRKQFLDEDKAANLTDAVIHSVNGDVLTDEKKNPNSEEIPFEGNWESSFGYVCDGEVIC